MSINLLRYDRLVLGNRLPSPIWVAYDNDRWTVNGIVLLAPLKVVPGAIDLNYKIRWIRWIRYLPGDDFYVAGHPLPEPILRTEVALDDAPANVQSQWMRQLHLGRFPWLSASR